MKKLASGFQKTLALVCAVLLCITLTPAGLFTGMAVEVFAAPTTIEFGATDAWNSAPISLGADNFVLPGGQNWDALSDGDYTLGLTVEYYQPLDVGVGVTISDGGGTMMLRDATEPALVPTYTVDFGTGPTLTPSSHNPEDKTGGISFDLPLVTVDNGETYSFAYRLTNTGTGEIWGESTPTFSDLGAGTYTLSIVSLDNTILGTSGDLVIEARPAPFIEPGSISRTRLVGAGVTATIIDPVVYEDATKSTEILGTWAYSASDGGVASVSGKTITPVGNGICAIMGEFTPTNTIDYDIIREHKMGDVTVVLPNDPATVTLSSGPYYYGDTLTGSVNAFDAASGVSIEELNLTSSDPTGFVVKPLSQGRFSIEVRTAGSATIGGTIKYRDSENALKTVDIQSINVTSEQRPLALAFDVEDKTYDGTKVAELGAWTLTNLAPWDKSGNMPGLVLGTDVFPVEFVSADAGENKALQYTAGDFAFKKNPAYQGAIDLTNYTLAKPPINALRATISPITLEVSYTFAEKYFDNTTAVAFAPGGDPEHTEADVLPAERADFSFDYTPQTVDSLGAPTVGDPENDTTVDVDLGLSPKSAASPPATICLWPSHPPALR